MYSDPQSVTVSGTAYPLARVGTKTPERLGQFNSADEQFILTTRQDKTTNRFRREVRLTQAKVAADPISATNKEVTASVMIVVDEPRWGFSNTELAAMTTSIMTWLSAANRDQLLAGEL
jgi:hypothetical protein